MAFVDSNVINKIRSNADIVDIIGSYIDLDERGKNFFGVCPFHDDHSPSMSVSREKQIYRCFTCGESGNVFTFLMNFKSITFMEAVKEVADKIGIKLDVNVSKKKNTHYQEFYDLYELSTNYYKNNLNSPEGERARQYLKSRKIDEEMIKRFGIGLSLKGGLSTSLLKKTDSKTLTDIALSYENNGVITDTFRERIVFPIKNLDGNIVAFSGRKYTDEEGPKYINTKETIIFKKSKTLYNYSDAINDIRRKKEIIICEGFMEVIRLNSVGITNAVALMGTSFTSDQLEVIKKLNVNVVLNLDNDDAGRLAAYTIGEVLTKEGIAPTIIVFDSYKDTDELIMNEGVEAFNKAYENRVPYIDYRLFYLKQNKDLKDATTLANYINDAIEAINSLNDDILKEIKIKELAREFDLNESTLRTKVKFGEVIVKPKVEVKEKKRKYNKYNISEMRIIYLMLNHKEVITNYEKNLGFLPRENMKKLANEIVYFKQKNGTFEYSDFITHIINRQELNDSLKEVLANNQTLEYTTKELEDYFTLVKKYEVEKQIRRLTELIRNTLDIEEKKKYAKRIEKMKMEVLEW